MKTLLAVVCAALAAAPAAAQINRDDQWMVEQAHKDQQSAQWLKDVQDKYMRGDRYVIDDPSLHDSADGSFLLNYKKGTPVAFVRAAEAQSALFQCSDFRGAEDSYRQRFYEAGIGIKLSPQQATQASEMYLRRWHQRCPSHWNDPAPAGPRAAPRGLDHAAMSKNVQRALAQKTGWEDRQAQAGASSAPSARPMKASSAAAAAKASQDAASERASLKTTAPPAPTASAASPSESLSQRAWRYFKQFGW